MRKNIFSLLVMFFAANSVIGSHVGEFVDILTTAERKDLKIFFGNSWYKNESYLEGLDSFTRDYLIDLILRHIIVLEHKIAQNKSGWQSWGVLKGAGWLAGSVVGGWVVHGEAQRLAVGSFGKVEVPDSQMNRLSAIKFSRSERKKLDLLSDAMKINNNKITLVFSPNWYYKVNYLSEKDLDKLSYLMLRLASQEVQGNMLAGLGIFVVCCGAAVYQFYKVTRYAERLVERLERDRRVLALLCDQRSRRLARFN